MGCVPTIFGMHATDREAGITVRQTAVCYRYGQYIPWQAATILSCSKIASGVLLLRTLEKSMAETLCRVLLDICTCLFRNKYVIYDNKILVLRVSGVNWQQQPCC